MDNKKEGNGEYSFKISDVTDVKKWRYNKD